MCSVCDASLPTLMAVQSFVPCTFWVEFGGRYCIIKREQLEGYWPSRMVTG